MNGIMLELELLNYNVHENKKITSLYEVGITDFLHLIFVCCVNYVPCL